jgi:hypothetical protein
MKLELLKQIVEKLKEQDIIDRKLSDADIEIGHLYEPMYQIVYLVIAAEYGKKGLDEWLRWWGEHDYGTLLDENGHGWPIEELHQWLEDNAR